LTLYADSAVQKSHSYRTKLEDLGSQDQYAAPEDDVTEDEGEEGHPESDDSLERKHKRPYPSPPRDIDLGGGWQLRNVQSDRDGDASETEPESEDNKQDDLAEEFDRVGLENVQVRHMLLFMVTWLSLDVLTAIGRGRRRKTEHCDFIAHFKFDREGQGRGGYC
jgi:hypothetical protein